MAVVLEATLLHLNADAGEDPSAFAFTVPSGTTKLVVFPCNVVYDGPRTADTVTWSLGGGEALTSQEVLQVTYGAVQFLRISRWERDNPTAGSGTLTVDWSGGARGAIAVFALSGAVTGPAYDSDKMGGGNPGALAPMAVDCPVGGLVIAVAATSDGTGVTLSLDSPGTVTDTGVGSPGGGYQATRMSLGYLSGTGSTLAPDFDFASGAPDGAGQMCAAYAPEAGGGGGVPTLDGDALVDGNSLVDTRRLVA